MKSQPTLRSRIVRHCKGVLKWVCILAVVYVAVLLIGLIPVNNDFVASQEGVTLYVVSNAVHADIIVPKQTSSVDWSNQFGPATFKGDVSSETHVAFGWGDQGFFLETETWDDLKLSIAANALFIPSQSCVHVSFTRPEYYSEAASVTVSPDQYRRLVEFINQTFKKDQDGRLKQIAGRSYSTNDAFFEAEGRYHVFNTCNSWVGRALKATGVRVPLFSPMPKSPMLYFEKKK